ncbi:MAG: Flp pilus assembly complex ATPase component TadA [Pseudomonadales bacterium]|nr:Flp pilus assembly complex ATPase component TadA [Pseudomonadales bacterium]
MSLFALQIEGPSGTRNLALGAACITVGSAADAALVLNGEGVARCHAELVRDEASGSYWLQDLGTTHGTWVNDERVVRYGPVGERDRVRIGSYHLRLARSGRESLYGHSRRWSQSTAVPPACTLPSTTAPWSDIATRVHAELIDRLDLRRRDIASMPESELRRQASLLLDELLRADWLRDVTDPQRFKQFVLDETLGLGPLEALLANDSITEIMVNHAAEIYVEQHGRLERAPVVFSSERALRGVIERIVARVGRRVDDASPMVDARLPDGSRVNVAIPPIALRGPAVTIRKFARRRLGPAELIAGGSLDEAMMDFLAICVEQRRNVIVSGGTGTGKTTLLNVLSGLVPANERVVTIEDAAELQLTHGNLITLEARPHNAEGRGLVTIRDLVRNALRMRPDRIVVGECRGGEALDMLQAMNTGHDGSLTTVHANTPRDALSRLEVMVLMAGMDLPVSAIREQISSAVQVIVQQTRFACGARRVTHIVEVTGIEGSRIQTQDVFRFVRTGVGSGGRVQGCFSGCGHVPTFYDDLERIGSQLDRSAFAVSTPRHDQ